MEEAGGADARGASPPSSHPPVAKAPPPPVIRTPWQLFRLHLVLLTWKNGVLQTRRPVSIHPSASVQDCQDMNTLPQHATTHLPVVVLDLTVARCHWVGNAAEGLVACWHDVACHCKSSFQRETRCCENSPHSSIRSQLNVMWWLVVLISVVNRRSHDWSPVVCSKQFLHDLMISIIHSSLSARPQSVLQNLLARWFVDVEFAN